jgi:hypothetical protein
MCDNVPFATIPKLSTFETLNEGKNVLIFFLKSRTKWE